MRCAVGVLALSALIASAGPAGADGLDRRDLEKAYVVQLDREDRSFSWSGDVGSCVAGEPAGPVQSDSLDALNFFRSVAGLSPVRLDAGASRAAQQAALMMAANGELSHYPTRFWRCASPEGIAAAGRSNLAMGTTGPKAIGGYLNDDGPSNQQVGHRTWLLHPGLRSVGIGSTPNTNAIAVFGDGVEYDPAPAQVTVAWPAAGPFSAGMVPSRWSLTTTSELAGDGSGWEGTSVTVSKGSRTWNPPIISRDRALVWYMDDTGTGTYQVRLSGPQAYDYDVEVFQPTVQMTVTPRLTGKARVGQSLMLRTGMWRPAASQTSVRWRVGKRVLPHSGRMLRVRRWMRGKTVKVRITAAHSDLRDLSLTLRKGPIKR